MVERRSSIKGSASRPESGETGQGVGAPSETLLAVDLGVRCGLALFSADGRLLWARSRNFGSLAALRRGLPGMLRALPGLTWLVLEGGGSIAKAWEKEGLRRGLLVRRVSAETWREALLLPRERVSAEKAKSATVDLAHRVIVDSGLPRPTSLTHDAAEAVCAGLWGVRKVGIIP